MVDVTEAACEAECQIQEGCNFFTYHNSNSSTYPETCFLLTELREPITHCENETCLSGSPNCDQNVCGFLDEGILYPNGIVVTESREIDLILIGSCLNPLAVAVGAGGSSRMLSSYDAGAGSGYVEFAEIDIVSPYRRFEATVGPRGSEEQGLSQLTDISDGKSLVTAQPGESGGYDEGASGYSGGGADCGSDNDFCDAAGADGGSNGGDGGDSILFSGGKGSGFDISTIPLKGFTLRYYNNIVSSCAYFRKTGRI